MSEGKAFLFRELMLMVKTFSRLTEYERGGYLLIYDDCFGF